MKERVVSFRTTVDMRKAIIRLAKDRCVSVSELLNDIVDEALSKQGS